MSAMSKIQMYSYHIKNNRKLSSLKIRTTEDIMQDFARFMKEYNLFLSANEVHPLAAGGLFFEIELKQRHEEYSPKKTPHMMYTFENITGASTLSTKVKGYGTSFDEAVINLIQKHAGATIIAPTNTERPFIMPDLTKYAIAKEL